MDLLEERALLLFFRICREIHNICVSGDRLSRVPLEVHLFFLLTIVLLLFGKRWSDSYLRCELFWGVALLHLCSKAGFTSKVYLRASGTPRPERRLARKESYLSTESAGRVVLFT